MQKTTKGRNVQHLRGRIQKIRAQGKGTISVHGAIQHLPNRPSPALEVETDAKFIHWRLTDGAKRRKWA